MPDNMKAVLYARVSSDRQEQEDTVQSQLGELRAALEDAGVSDWQEFIDEGYARDNLVRPALDRLRDLAAQRDVSKVYVQRGQARNPGGGIPGAGRRSCFLEGVR